MESIFRPTIFYCCFIAIFYRFFVAAQAVEVVPSSLELQIPSFNSNVNSIALGSSTDGPGAHQIYKDELQELRRAITSALIVKHNRIKRETVNYRFEPKLEPIPQDEADYSEEAQNQTVAVNTGPPTQRAIVFKDTFVHFTNQAAVATQLHPVVTNETDGYSSNVPLSVAEKILGGWYLRATEKVFAVYETHQMLFIHVSDVVGGHSRIFTYSPASKELAVRQRIKNLSTVKDSKFFLFHYALYLVVAKANDAGSLTNCPIYKWAGAHFDEIYVIQSRGAVSVDTTIISGRAYIALAQERDQSGNSEVGTRILRMSSNGAIETIQLLYSVNPVKVYFTKMYHEKVLVVVQKSKGSNIFMYGGFDFLHQHLLPTLYGENIQLATLRSPHGESFLLASNGTHIMSFSPDRSDVTKSALVFMKAPFLLYSLPPEHSVVGLTLNTLHYGDASDKFTNDELVNQSIILAVTTVSGREETAPRSINFFHISFRRVPIVLSRVVIPDDKLTKCLKKLNDKLDATAPFVEELKELNKTILRRSMDFYYNGTLSTNFDVSIHDDGARILTMTVQPNVDAEDRANQSPKDIQGSVETISATNNQLEEKLKTSLKMDSPGVFSVPITFINATIDELNTNSIDLTSLNGHDWNRLIGKSLRFSKCESSSITGRWEVTDDAYVEDVQASSILGIETGELVLTEADELQGIDGYTIFEKEATLNSLETSSYGKLNDLHITNIFKKGGDSNVISGTKQARHVEVDSESSIGYLESIDVAYWFDQAMHTDCENQVSNASIRFENGFNTKELDVSIINGVNWNEFHNDVLRDHVDQRIPGNPIFENLEVEALAAETINGVRVNEVMNTKDDQDIYSAISSPVVTIQGNIRTKLVNGYIMDGNVVQKSKDAEIVGDLAVEKFTVNELAFSNHEAASMNGINMPHEGRSNKVVIYTLDQDHGGAVHIHSLKATNADFITLNGESVYDRQKSWLNRYADNSVFLNPADPYKVENVVITDSLKTDKLCGEEEYVSLKDSRIDIPLEIEVAVLTHDVEIDNSTVNGLSISEWYKTLVHKDATGKVHGDKSISNRVILPHGIYFKAINDALHHDFVMLRNGRSEYTLGKVLFTDSVNASNCIVEDDFELMGKLNGIDVSELDLSTIDENSTCAVKDDIVFHDLRMEDLVVMRLNNYNLNDIVSYAIPLESQHPVYIKRSLELKDSLVCHDTTYLEDINGVHPDEYFSQLVKRTENERITETKTFLGKVLIQEDLICNDDEFNHVNLKHLQEDYVSKTKLQQLTGDVTIESLRVDSAYFDKVCGQDPIEEFVDTYSDKPQVIDGPVIIQGDNDTVIHQIAIPKPKNQYNDSDASGLENLPEEGPDALRFKSLKCQSYTWDSPNPSENSLHHVLDHALRKSEETQLVTTSVTFDSAVDVGKITSEEWFNLVDLAAMSHDGVLRNETYELLEFTGNINTSNSVVLPAGDLTVRSQFNTELINGISLAYLNSKIVRKNVKEPVRGIKTIAHSIDAEHLQAEEINGQLISEIVTLPNDRVIPQIRFRQLSGVHTVNFSTLNLFKWNGFCDALVVNGTDQEINGRWNFKDTLFAKHFTAGRINDVYINSTVMSKAGEEQQIYGKKEFKEITAYGDIEARSINGYDMDDIKRQVVPKDGPYEFHGPVHMEGPVTFSDDILTHSLNGHNLANVPNALKEYEGKIYNHSALSTDEIKLFRSAVHKLEKDIEKAPAWLNYVSMEREVSFSSVEVTVGAGSLVTYLDHAPVTDSYECGLPKGCYFPVSYEATFSTLNLMDFRKSQCERKFHFEFGHDSVIQILSQSVSYNETCKGTNGGTKITIERQGGNQIVNLVGHGNLGYITFAQVFEDDTDKYLVLTKTTIERGLLHEVLVYTYVEDEFSFNLVQFFTIPNPSPVALERVGGNFFLAVGSTSMLWPKSASKSLNYDELSNRADYSGSDIYTWAPCKSSYGCEHHHHFILLRRVPMGDVIDIKFFSSHHKTEEDFVALVYEGNMVEILKYDHDFKNFMHFQRLDFGEATALTSVTSFTVKNILYLVFGSVPEGIVVYEYRCVEGFTRLLSAPADQIREIDVFQAEYGTHLAVASQTRSFIASLVIEGNPSTKA